MCLLRHLKYTSVLTYLDTCAVNNYFFSFIVNNKVLLSQTIHLMAPTTVLFLDLAWKCNKVTRVHKKMRGGLSVSNYKLIVWCDNLQEVSSHCHYLHTSSCLCT